MACTVQAQLVVATTPQQRTLGSQRRVGAHCAVHKKDERTRCSMKYGSSASHQLQITGKSFFSGTSIRATVKRPAVSKRAGVITRASWNDFEWTPVKITEHYMESGMHHVTLDVGEEIVKGYTKPGQFVQVCLTREHKSVFLAISSAPGTTTTTLDLLIKPQPGSAADDLCHLSPGDTVEVSPVMGKGFDVNGEVPGAETILIFATGSGISPIKALIEATPENGGLNATTRKDVRLYYGAQKKEVMAFQDKFDKWEASGVKVVPVWSQVSPPHALSPLQGQPCQPTNPCRDNHAN